MALISNWGDDIAERSLCHENPKTLGFCHFPIPDQEQIRLHGYTQGTRYICQYCQSPIFPHFYGREGESVWVIHPYVTHQEWP